MSTNISSRATAGPALYGHWTGDLRTVRTIRYAVGVTASVAIAFGLAWPLYILTPVFTGVFLSLPLPGPTLKQAFKLFGYVAVAFAIGLAFTMFLLPYPLIYLPALGIALFHIYYLVNRRGPVMLGLMSLIAVLVLSMLGNAHEALATVFALQFAGSMALAVLFYVLAHGLLPDPPGDHQALAHPGFQSGYSRVAALTALKSTITVFPLAILFISANLSGQLLILLYAAIYSITPDLAKGREAGMKGLFTTAIGGLAAMAIFWLIVAVPEYHFFITVMFLVSLIFAQNIFSDTPIAKYLPSAFVALLVLLSGGLGEDTNFTGKFFMRLILICAATLYVVGAMSVLDELFERIMQRPDKNR